MNTSTELLEPNPTNHMDGWSPGELHETLRRRRTAVLKHIDQFVKSDVLSEMVFDLLIHLALNPDSELDDKLVESFAWRHELELEDAQLRLLDGSRKSIPEVIRNDLKPSTIELINAHLSRGFARKITPLEEGDRRSFTGRVVGLLPGIERVGPFIISDYLDLVCSEDDAQRFWNAYTERVAAEVSKRGGETEDEAIPWLLYRLVVLNADAPLETRGRAWLTLKQHVRRVLRIDRHRWRHLRTLLEGCSDLNIVHYVCSSPTIVEDPDALFVFLTRGDEKLISCALFTMQIRPGLDELVARLLEHFRTRPLPEIAHRVTEVYAQTSLPIKPSANLERLRLGLKSLVKDRVKEGGAVDSLAQAIANDARAFRHGALLADLAQEEGFARGVAAQHLLERVLTTFFQSFTPSGVDHPLNDESFRDMIRRSLRALVTNGNHRIRERIDSFGLELRAHVERWTGDVAPEPIKTKLLGRFASVYADTVMPLARTLYAEAEAQEEGRALYRIMIRVFLEHGAALEGHSSFGVLEFAFSGMYPELVRVPLDQIEVGRLIDISHVIARLDQVLGSSDDFRFVKPGQTVEAAPTRLGALLNHRPDRESPLRAPAELLDRRQTTGGSIFRAYLGLEFLDSAKERIMRLLGFRREGELILTDREMVIISKRTMGDRVIERTGDSHALEDLMAVTVRQRMRIFYMVLGLLGLVTSALFGGHLLFVGLRGGETAMSVLGGTFVVLGILFDAAMSRLSEKNQNNVVLELKFASSPRYFNILLDMVSGADVLDAFMALDAEKRELALLDRWVDEDSVWLTMDDVVDASD